MSAGKVKAVMQVQCLCCEKSFPAPQIRVQVTPRGMVSLACPQCQRPAGEIELWAMSDVILEEPGPMAAVPANAERRAQTRFESPHSFGGDRREATT